MALAIKEDRALRGVEVIAERPDGTRVTLLQFPTPLHNAAGNLIGAVNVLVDITIQKAAQTELHGALRSRDDVLDQISHEFRNPVTQIAGFSQLLATRWRDLPLETQAESLEGLRSQAIRLQRLLEDMLVLSRVEGEVPPQSEPQLIQRRIEDTVRGFRNSFPRTAVRVDIELGLPPANVSVGAIDHVVWNLLANAREHGRPGGTTELKCRLVDGWIEVVVLDDGPEIADDEIARIFQPYRPARATPAELSGLGLGLAVCKRLVETELGEIWARRGASGGMEFGFRYPAVACADEE